MPNASHTIREETDHVASLDWANIRAELDSHGFAVIGPILTVEQCETLTTTYDNEGLFRSRVVMARHGYGRGEYQYFAYPLPGLIGSLRTALYRPLAEIANHWNATMNIDVQFPQEHHLFIDRCHKAGQLKPTPLLLRYGPDDFNCLHQDLYGEHVFPLQVAFLLSKPGIDFTGGEFVLTEQRRACSRVSKSFRSARAGCNFPGQSSACAGHARRVSRQYAARRKSVTLRPALHPGDHFSRRYLTAFVALFGGRDRRRDGSVPAHRRFSTTLAGGQPSVPARESRIIPQPDRVPLKYSGNTPSLVRVSLHPVSRGRISMETRVVTSDMSERGT